MKRIVRHQYAVRESDGQFHIDLLELAWTRVDTIGRALSKVDADAIAKHLNGYLEQPKS